MGPELSGASATGQPLAQRPRAVFQGEAYRQFVKGLAQANKLVRGELLIDGNAVDASQIACGGVPLMVEKRVDAGSW